MNAADYRDLVELLQEQLRNVGAGELADISQYSASERHTSDLRSISPREHVIAMLQAFHRYLWLRDRNTFATSLARINEALVEPALEDAAFVPVGEDSEDSSCSLGGAPDLTSLRAGLTNPH